ncbi:MAG: tRNA uridine-5-carboxymethylaminomethyl(34) synthesis enzyme MnmG [Bacteroidetes bacterium]|jgi:tRNA uridine 5-carboxymethylaminomethyl modification enzyme|nr:tRNA uridine-5-carboxymethylaminomethyl(34) synthesis enzyme MnmG [Bacteroidota bacterium]MBL0015938.1 tRNA uridine-5-carboxymethylaminomethyl(34) synthesis enzyme MnmG [Bacteroidota bacterium]
MFPNYDVIVVGAGHAGCEAAAAAANMGMKVLLTTMNMNTIAQMSCNPAMGGVAKGQLVREIDAMGGYSGIVTDKTMIQFRMLNRSKGPAMWSPRAQSDRMRFAEEWRLMLEQTPNVDFWQEMVRELVVKDGRVVGVKTSMGIEIPGKTVVLTNGTFLNGLIHIGEKNFGGGRAGEKAATGITEQLQELGFQSGRMKTGTPPRLDGRTIDYTKLEIQEGDENPAKFSFGSETHPLTKQLPCHIAHTNQKVHDTLATGFAQSPMFAGRIQGLGPRYCPSIEDKIVRFADKSRHQLFVEPEGWNTVEVYVNGFSSSLPEDVQYKAIRQIEGFENVKMFRPGYAIEYDFFPPQQLKLSLETHLIQGLFFAGQINGTTGYEEAACQGMMAGINAARKCQELDPIVLKRDEAYIGVLIDDLVNKGTEEPYRMFTSRAEFRILLRQDNADLRLTKMARDFGMVSDNRFEEFSLKAAAISEAIGLIERTSISPDQINGLLEQKGLSPLSQSVKAEKVLTRPELTLQDLMAALPEFGAALAGYSTEVLEQAEIQKKYDGYIRKEREQAEKVIRLDDIRLPEDFDYHKVKALSFEGREKLSRSKPNSLGQASRISGVRPADISVLMVFIGR